MSHEPFPLSNSKLRIIIEMRPFLTPLVEAGRKYHFGTCRKSPESVAGGQTKKTSGNQARSAIPLSSAMLAGLAKVPSLYMTTISASYFWLR
jgi:hypothetical protein